MLVRRADLGWNRAWGEDGTSPIWPMIQPCGSRFTYFRMGDYPPEAPSMQFYRQRVIRPERITTSSELMSGRYSRSRTVSEI